MSPFGASLPVLQPQPFIATIVGAPLEARTPNPEKRPSPNSRTCHPVRQLMKKC